MIAGLLGEKLSHSYSPFIHREFADYQYKLFEVEKDRVEDFLKNGDYHCLNVTIPYKKIALALADEASDIAKRIGSANTIVKKNGKIYATNSDYYGFKMLFDTLKTTRRKKAVVLGTGGASLAIKAVLEDKGFEQIIFISRNSATDNYSNISRHSDADIIVNTTPVGMYPGNVVSPIDDIGVFKSLEGVFDIIYNPRRTKLMLDCEARGIRVAGGLLMLVGQAAVSSEVFTGQKISDEKIKNVLNKLDSSMQNIALIGMPGCGKSTVGRLLSNILGRTFYDLDEEFEKVYKISPKDCIIKSGEQVFRDKETEVLKNISKLSECVISTGGGVVERGDNYNLLHQNSTIIYVKRPLESLSTESRPLSVDLHSLFKRRSRLYEKFCDFEVSNTSSPSACAEQIVKLVGR